MSTVMQQSREDDPISPFLFGPIQPQPISTTSINDPAFNHIYDFIRDPSKTTFEFPPSSYSSGVLNDSTSNHDLYSETVNPICTIPVSNESPGEGHEPHVSRTPPEASPSESKAIDIDGHPRSKFRPRTEKESHGTSHYIRTEAYIEPSYPSIKMKPSWRKENSIIEVTLVDKDGNPHPYAIDNKDRHKSPLIFKQNEPNSLYFYVTEEDHQQGRKIFYIEYIKLKQDALITKSVIKARRLDQSMLRFTRFYAISDGSYKEDESSTAYSCLMTEDYGEFSVEDIFPLYGPMAGNQKVCVELRGHLPKDLNANLRIILTGDGINYSEQITNFRKKGNNLTFQMPPFPFPQLVRAKVNICLQYQQETLYQAAYIYTGKLDEALASPVHSSDGNGVLPTYSSSEARSTKRARQ